MSKHLLLAAATLAGGLFAQTSAVVSPRGLTNVYGNINNSVPWGSPGSTAVGEMFCQQIDADLLGTPRVFKGFAFRHQYTVAHAAKMFTATLTVGDAASLPAAMSTTFATNWKTGGSKTVVVNGAINFPALGTYPFPPAPADSPVPFTTPHPYTGTDPLLWELNITAASPITPTIFFERGPGSTHIAGRIGNGCTITGGTAAMSLAGTVTTAAMTNNLSNGPLSAPAALAIGDTSSTLGGLPLPVDLTPFGWPGCYVHINFLVTVPYTTTATGTLATSMPYTMSPAVSSLRLRTQVAAIDSASLLRTSNGLDHSVPYAPTGVPWPQNRVFVSGYTTLPTSGALQSNGLVTEWWY